MTKDGSPGRLSPLFICQSSGETIRRIEVHRAAEHADISCPVHLEKYSIAQVVGIEGAPWTDKTGRW